TDQVTVNVVCNQPPVARCRPRTVTANAACQGIAAASLFNNGSTDPDGDALSFSISPAGPFPLGVTNITLTVTDSKGASSSCSTTVTVVDGIRPVLTVPAPVTITAAAGQCTVAASGVNL